MNQRFHIINTSVNISVLALAQVPRLVQKRNRIRPFDQSQHNAIRDPIIWRSWISILLSQNCNSARSRIKEIACLEGGARPPPAATRRGGYII
jgi:hypothetical protein